MKSIFIKIIILGTLIIFLTGGFLGMFHFGMNDNPDGTLSSHCLMPGMGNTCEMGLRDHVVEWQNMLAILTVDNGIVSTILTLLAFFILGCFLSKYIGGTFSYQSPPLDPPKFYLIKPIHFFDHLKEAFSKGILNPKLH